MKDWLEGDAEVEEMDIVGCSLAWLTRMMLPSEGEMEGNLTPRMTDGVKDSGMIFEGSRFALLSEGMRVLEAIVGAVVERLSADLEQQRCSSG